MSNLQHTIDGIQPVLNTLDNLTSLVFDYEKEFNEEVFNGLIFDIISLEFSSEYVSVHYILECGQHIGGAVTMKNFLLFVNKYKQKWEDKHGRLI